MTMRAQILRLARAGALERAWALFEQSGLADQADNPDALTLKARLIKARAMAARGGERNRLFSQSGQLYERAAQLAPASYPLINGASTALLSGRPEHARKLARRVLSLLDTSSDDAETPYWLAATRAEAFLLLGRLAEARAALRHAISLAPHAWEDHASTLAQFRLLCEDMGEDHSWLDQLRPPTSVRFSGIIGVDVQRGKTLDIARWLDQEKVGFGYGALAAGCDIQVAQSLLERGSELHVVLPCPVDAFRQWSVTSVAALWTAQFDALLDSATSLMELRLEDAPSMAGANLAKIIAGGLAIGNARRLQSRAMALHLAPADEVIDSQVPEHLPLTRLEVTRDMASAGWTLPVGGACAFLVARADEAVPPRAIALREARAYIRTAIASGAAVAVDVAIGDCRGDPNLFAGLLDAAQPGQALATWPAALALAGLDDDMTVEPLGEMRSSRGSAPFCLIA